MFLMEGIIDQERDAALGNGGHTFPSIAFLNRIIRFFCHLPLFPSSSCSSSPPQSLINPFLLNPPFTNPTNGGPL